MRDGANGEIGCRAAAAEAFRRAVQAAHPSRLEPIMAVEVTVDDEFLGAVIGDLNQRRGQVQDVGARGTKRVVSAHVALRNMFGYSTRAALPHRGSRDVLDDVPRLRHAAVGVAR